MKSAVRALDILELLSGRPRPLPASAIARLCRIPRSSVYPLLSGLAARQMITADIAGRWSLSGRLAEIGGETPSLTVTLALLDAFQDGSERLDAPALSRRSRCDPVTVARVLPLLSGEGLVTRNPDESYSLGLRVALLSAKFSPIDQLRRAARPALVDLRDGTGETANLVVRDGAHAIYLDQVESEWGLRHASWVGRRISLERSASGRAFARQRHPHTVRDVIEKGVTAVACSIKGSASYPAAVSITGPSLRLRSDQLKTAKRLVVSAAVQVSERLEAQR